MRDARNDIGMLVAMVRYLLNLNEDAHVTFAATQVSAVVWSVAVEYEGFSVTTKADDPHAGFVKLLEMLSNRIHDKIEAGALLLKKSRERAFDDALVPVED